VDLAKRQIVPQLLDGPGLRTAVADGAELGYAGVVAGLEDAGGVFVLGIGNVHCQNFSIHNVRNDEPPVSAPNRRDEDGALHASDARVKLSSPRGRHRNLDSDDHPFARRRGVVPLGRG